MPRISKLILTGAMLLLVSMTAVACTTFDNPDTVLVAEFTIETIVAETVEAQAAVDLIIQQTVAAQVAAQSPAADPAADAAQPPAADPAADPAQPPAADPAADPAQPPADPNAPDVADPNSGIEAIKPVADPNTAAGTPQLKVIYSSINVRSGPGTNCRAISALLKDSVVPLKSRNQDGKWLEITLPNGQNGWVADSVTDPVVAADMARVPVSNTPYCPPPPTATPTSTPPPTKTPIPTNTTVPPTHTAVATTAATATTVPTAVPTATEPSPQVIPSNVQVLNNTTTDIWFIFIDLSSEPNWSSDKLGSNILLPGEQITFNMGAGEYDMMAQDDQGNVIADQFNVFVTGFTQWDIR